MTCPHCGSTSAASHAVRFSEARVYTCIDCHHTFADVHCAVLRSKAGGKPCNRIPTLRCVECQRFVCSTHEANQRGNRCKSCLRSLSAPRRPVGGTRQWW